MPASIGDSIPGDDERLKASGAEPSPDRVALDDLFARLYDKIRKLASRLRWNGSNPTLNPTALANEAYLKLLKDPPDLASKSYDEVIAIFANTMRQILIDASRRKQALKRDFAATPEQKAPRVEDDLVYWLTFDAFLKEIERENPRQAQIIDCRYCLSMTVEETAAALNLSKSTVEREWREAKTKLGDTIHGESR